MYLSNVFNRLVKSNTLVETFIIITIKKCMNVQKGSALSFVYIFHGDITDDAYGQHFTVGNFVSAQKFVQSTNLNKVFLFFFFILPHLYQTSGVGSLYPCPPVVTQWLYFKILPLTHAAVISQTSQINKLG